jgi:hypothetical protein
MYIQRQVCFFACQPHNVRPERNVIDEMAVHDVAMDPIRACCLDAMNFLSEPQEICRENRWGDDHFCH